MQAEMLDTVVSSNSQELSDASASSAIKLFENPLFKVRVIMRLGDPWFVAKDVATCIEHSNVTKMCELCRDKDRIVENVAVLKQTNESLECFSGQQSPNLTLISESGLYRILAKCNLPKCEPFESWVFDEVLPSIRKTGSYSVVQPQPQMALLRLQEVIGHDKSPTNRRRLIKPNSSHRGRLLLTPCNAKRAERSCAQP